MAEKLGVKKVQIIFKCQIKIIKISTVTFSCYLKTEVIKQ